MEKQELFPHSLLREEIRKELQSYFHLLLKQFEITPNGDGHFYPVNCSVVTTFIQMLLSDKDYHTRNGDASKKLADILGWDVQSFFKPLWGQKDYSHASWLLYVIAQALPDDDHLQPFLDCLPANSIIDALGIVKTYMPADEHSDNLKTFWDKRLESIENSIINF